MKHLWKKLAALALSAVLMLPVVPAAQAEETTEDLMDFAGAVSAMIADYGLESESGEAGLLDLELEAFSTARLIVKAEGEIDPLNAVSVAEGFCDLHVLQFADPAAAAEAFEVYSAMDGVEYVEPDGIVTLETEEESVGQVPSGTEAPDNSVELLADSEFLSWGYGEYDPEQYSYGINLSALHSWAEKKTRESVIVAVVDSGVMADHEFLRGYVLANKGYDFINDDNDPDDDNSHGTHVAGTIVDGTRALGNVKILPVKVLGANGRGSWLAISMGVLYAVEQGADVINMSIGGDFSYVLREAVDRAVESGVTVVVSAGNDDTDAANQAPACFDNVICVAASGYGGYLASFWSGGSNYGEVVDVTAPGCDIYSSVPYIGDESRYQYMDGTSMATPHISAVAAILLSVDSTLTPAQMELRLEAACTHPLEDWSWERESEIVIPNLLDAAELTGTKVSQISISRETASVCVGQEFQLTALTTPKGSAVSWSSSDPEVASVKNGTVTCLKEGEAVITASASKGALTVSCAVTVRKLELTVPEERVTLPVGGSTRVHIEAERFDPMPKLTWSVKDEAVAGIYVLDEEDGNLTTTNGVVVRGLKAGTTTVSASFGGVSADMEVVIENPGSWYDTDGSDGFADHIKTVEDLKEFAWMMNYGADDFANRTVYLDNDLDMTGQNDWEMPFDFNGTFDGNGNTVSNLTFCDAEYGYIGLFGSIAEEGVVRNLTLENVSVSCIGEGESNVAGLAAENYGRIEACHVSGTISAPGCEKVGGIAGSNYGTIEDCSNAAEITGDSVVAGIAGESDGDILACTNSGDICGESQQIGGVVGYSSGGTVSGCDNTGSAAGYRYVGGVVGQSDGLVEDCSNEGSVNAVGMAQYGTIYYGDTFGGIVGYSSCGTVRDCTNTGLVHTGASYVGGILGCGYGAEVENCWNNAESVAGRECVGGIIGAMEENYYSGYAPASLLAVCGNTAAVTATGDTVGGMIGYGVNVAIEFCWNSGSVRGGSTVDGYDSGGYQVGGIAGSLYNSELHLRDCSNSGDITGNSYVGGIAGKSERTWDAGEGAYAQIYNCINYGTVTAGTNYSSCYGGGIVGGADSTWIRNCLSAGDVSGWYAGGFTGCSKYGGLVENCVVQGQVSGTSWGLFSGHVADGSHGLEEIRFKNCYAEPSGTSFGYAGDRCVKENCSGFRFDSEAGTYVLAKSVTADGKTVADLIDALNTVALACHEDDAYDLAFWAEVDDGWSEKPGLEHMYGVAVKSAAGSKAAYELVGTLDWSVFRIDSDNEIELIAARYDSGRMTAAGPVSWEDGYLLKADLSEGSGSDYRVFGVDAKTFAPAEGTARLS